MIILVFPAIQGDRILMHIKGKFSWTKWVNTFQEFWCPLEFLFLGEFSWTFLVTSHGYSWWIFLVTFSIVMIRVTLLSSNYFLTLPKTEQSLLNLQGALPPTLPYLTVTEQCPLNPSRGFAPTPLRCLIKSYYIEKSVH